MLGGLAGFALGGAGQGQTRDRELARREAEEERRRAIQLAGGPTVHLFSGPSADRLQSIFTRMQVSLDRIADNTDKMIEQGRGTSINNLNIIGNDTGYVGTQEFA